MQRIASKVQMLETRMIGSGNKCEPKKKNNIHLRTLDDDVLKRRHCAADVVFLQRQKRQFWQIFQRWHVAFEREMFETAFSLSTAQHDHTYLGFH
jgi:hypothetical protein